MIGINTVYIFAFIIVFIIIFITRLIDIKPHSAKLTLYECSLFFDAVSEDKDVKVKCEITQSDFKNLRNNIDSFLTYLNNLGYINSEFFVMNKKNCAFYSLRKGLKICNDINKCKKCMNFWKNFRNKPGKLLKNNLIKKDTFNEIILYKTYECGIRDTFIIGVTCQDKL